MKWSREKDEELLSAVKKFTQNDRVQWDPIQKQMGIGVVALKSRYRKLSENCPKTNYSWSTIDFRELLTYVGLYGHRWTII